MYALNPRNDWKELASRHTDGLQVSLLWNHQDGCVKVTVTDARLDRQFEIPVAGAEALAAFYHPFAHAASQSSNAVEVARDFLNQRQ